MKISSYHKFVGDNVIYTRELIKKTNTNFSKIYIATRFSFHWKKTRDLINYYQKNFNAELVIGGIHASINPGLYESNFGIKPIIGSFKGNIDTILDRIKNDEILASITNEIIEFGIDVLPPDYSIFDGQVLPFSTTLDENYLLRATKGCNRRCKFCDVKKICENYIDKLPIIPIINYIDKNYGKKRNILFFDDNTLMSKKFDSIIEDLKALGFEHGAKFKRKNRACDFNQGMDLRLLNDGKLELLNSICLNPIRFAFDDISIKDIYIENIVNVIESGTRNISVYVLYNFHDRPEDFYERLYLSVKLNEQYESRIFSFPMKYVPNDLTNRNYIGKHWTRRMIRGVQCILNSSHGIVPVKLSFFYKAFGRDIDEFLKIIHMPENYIVHRYFDKEIGKKVETWDRIYHSLTKNEMIIAKELISGGKGKVSTITDNSLILSLLSHYSHEAMHT